MAGPVVARKYVSPWLNDVRDGAWDNMVKPFDHAEEERHMLTPKYDTPDENQSYKKGIDTSEERHVNIKWGRRRTLLKNK